MEDILNEMVKKSRSLVEALARSTFNRAKKDGTFNPMALFCYAPQVFEFLDNVPNAEYPLSMADRVMEFLDLVDERAVQSRCAFVVVVYLEDNAMRLMFTSSLKNAIEISLMVKDGVVEDVPFPEHVLKTYRFATDFSKVANLIDPGVC